MASAASIIVAGLRADTGISALVGERIYPADSVPRLTSFPYIAYTVTSSTPDYDLGGTLQGYEASILLEVAAVTKSGAEAIRVLLPAFAKSLAGQTLDSATVDDGIVSDDGDEVTGPIELSGWKAYLAQVTISIFYGG